MADQVLIEGLEVRTVIGVYDWEREIRQTIRLDLAMDWDMCRPGQSDAIEDALDYKAVSQRLVDFIEQSDFALIEALAEACAALVLEEFGVQHLRLKIAKPLKYLGMDCAVIVIERPLA